MSITCRWKRWAGQSTTHIHSFPMRSNYVFLADLIGSIHCFLAESYFQLAELIEWHFSTIDKQIEFLNCFAAEVGLPPFENWRHQLYRKVVHCIYSDCDDEYRDTLDADEWIQQWQLSLQRFLWFIMYAAYMCLEICQKQVLTGFWDSMTSTFIHAG